MYYVRIAFHIITIGCFTAVLFGEAHPFLLYGLLSWGITHDLRLHKLEEES